MKYFVKTPWWLKKFYPSYIWDIRTKEKIIYLSFDDGPHPTATPFVLDTLTRYNAKASFFCIGKNVAAFPDVYRRIVEEGHTVGNHTFNHLNGWTTADDVYLKDIVAASNLIDSSLFRPPYGRITAFQAKNIASAMKRPSSRIIMWDVLSGDFDATLTKDRCLENVTMNAKNGSIVVFHDSEKAYPLMEYCLPRVLEYHTGKGFRFEVLPNVMNNDGDGEKKTIC